MGKGSPASGGSGPLLATVLSISTQDLLLPSHGPQAMASSCPGSRRPARAGGTREWTVRICGWSRRRETIGRMSSLSPTGVKGRPDTGGLSPACPPVPGLSSVPCLSPAWPTGTGLPSPQAPLPREAELGIPEAGGGWGKGMVWLPCTLGLGCPSPHPAGIQWGLGQGLEVKTAGAREVPS